MARTSVFPFARPFASKPHFTDPTGSLFVWLTEPAGMVDHVVPGRMMTNDMAVWLVGPATDAMLARGAATGVARFTFVHDWRGVAGYESAARARLIQWGRVLASKIERIEIAISPSAPALFRMAVHGGTMMMSVLRIPCFVTNDIEEALRRARVRPAESV